MSILDHPRVIRQPGGAFAFGHGLHPRPLRFEASLADRAWAAAEHDESAAERDRLHREADGEVGEWNLGSGYDPAFEAECDARESCADDDADLDQDSVDALAALDRLFWDTFAGHPANEFEAPADDADLDFDALDLAGF